MARKGDRWQSRTFAPRIKNVLNHLPLVMARFAIPTSRLLTCIHIGSDIAIVRSIERWRHNDAYVLAIELSLACKPQHCSCVLIRHANDAVCSHDNDPFSSFLVLKLLHARVFVSGVAHKCPASMEQRRLSPLPTMDRGPLGWDYVEQHCELVRHRIYNVGRCDVRQWQVRRPQLSLKQIRALSLVGCRKLPPYL
jgi:hypothetical protein